MSEFSETLDDLEPYEHDQQIKDRDRAIRERDGTIRQLLKDKADLEAALGWSKLPVKPPKWLAPRRKKHGDHVAIVCAMMSDLHLDEVVDPGEMGGLNAYNREIAAYRLRQFFENNLKITQHYWKGTRYEGEVLIGGGDIFTGIIHSELDRTNDGQGPYESLEYWVPHIIAGIDLHLSVYPHLFIPWTIGNHGRFRQGKWQMKRRVKENIDWALGKRLEAYYANDERVNFLIPDSPDVPFTVYEKRFLLNHGVQNGGNGQAGIFSPLGILMNKKRRSYEFDVLTAGHWHQDVFTPEQGYIVNSSLKGYDDFGLNMGFRPERPSQSLWLVTPEHGITEHAPILVSDRKAEGW